MKTEPIVGGIREVRQAFFVGEASVDTLRPIFERMGLRPTTGQIKAVSLGLGVTVGDLLEIISVFREQACGRPLSGQQIEEILSELYERQVEAFEDAYEQSMAACDYQ
jgi:hypothetical protein